jgi:fatty-acyl-CoA synthase
MTDGNHDHVVSRWITEGARPEPQRAAIVFPGYDMTYNDLDEGSSRLADALIGHGLRHGDRVATLTENRPEHVELFFACAKARLVLVPLNRFHTATELASQLRAFIPTLVVGSASHFERIEEACRLLDSSLRPLTLEGLVSSLAAHSSPVPQPHARDDDPLLLMPTSGSTGAPKGVMLTHANCYWTNVSLDLSMPMTADDVVLQFLPQYHIGGWNVQPLLAWRKGATVVLEPKFEPDRVLELIESRQVTLMMGVPTNYLLLAQHPRFDDADLTSLRMAVVGGAAMPPSLLQRWRSRGVDVAQGYGLTEAAPNVLCLAPSDAGDHIGSVGKPYAYVDVALYDELTDHFVEGPGRGELFVRGPNVFAGYWNNPKATSVAFHDGWLRTGDVAERDADGYYRISGRTKEMYVSGGENVYPVEIERTLAMHADVVEAAVVATEHPKWGESGAAFVLVRPGSTVTDDELSQHCRALLARFKVPTEFHIVTELPRSPLGKIDKLELKAMLGRTHDFPSQRDTSTSHKA